MGSNDYMSRFLTSAVKVCLAGVHLPKICWRNRKDVQLNAPTHPMNCGESKTQRILEKNSPRRLCFDVRDQGRDDPRTVNHVPTPAFITLVQATSQIIQAAADAAIHDAVTRADNQAAEDAGINREGHV